MNKIMNNIWNNIWNKNDIFIWEKFSGNAVSQVRCHIFIFSKIAEIKNEIRDHVKSSLQ
jgi:hypothetical protein